MPNETFALFDTTEGTFKIKLFDDKAPKTVENFVSLADGTKTGKPFYDGIIFHRVIPDFMIQGGCPEGSGRGGPGYKFADEFHPDLKHSKKGCSPWPMPVRIQTAASSSSQSHPPHSSTRSTLYLGK